MSERRRAAGGAVTVDRVPWHDDDAARLRADQQREVSARFGDDGDIAVIPAEEMLATVVVRVDGVVAGCGALRDASRLGERTGEIKRMYVVPEFRRRGLSRVVLSELERIALDHGMTRLVLETGDRLHEAIALYRSNGYEPIDRFHPYTDEPDSVCLARTI